MARVGHQRERYRRTVRREREVVFALLGRLARIAPPFRRRVGAVKRQLFAFDLPRESVGVGSDVSETSVTFVPEDVAPDHVDDVAARVLAALIEMGVVVPAMGDGLAFQLCDPEAGK